MSSIKPVASEDGITSPIILNEQLADVRGVERHFVLTMTGDRYNVGYIKTVLTDGRTACEPVPNASGMTFIDFFNYAYAYILPDGLKPVITNNLTPKQWAVFLLKSEAMKIKMQEN